MRSTFRPFKYNKAKKIHHLFEVVIELTQPHTYPRTKFITKEFVAIDVPHDQ
jgi:hypothetical protein